MGFYFSFFKALRSHSPLLWLFLVWFDNQIKLGLHVLGGKQLFKKCEFPHSSQFTREVYCLFIQGSCNATGISVHGNCSSQSCLWAAITTASAPCGSKSLSGEALACTVQFSHFKQQVFTAKFSLKNIWRTPLPSCLVCGIKSTDTAFILLSGSRTNRVGK